MVKPQYCCINQSCEHWVSKKNNNTHTQNKLKHTMINGTTVALLIELPRRLNIKSIYRKFTQLF